MDYINQIIEIYKEEYQESRGLEYHSSAKDRSAVGKLQRLYKNKDKNTQDSLLDFRSFFKKCLEIEDKWLFENMTLSIINSKINEIKARLLNGTNKNGITKIKSERFADRYTKRFIDKGH